MNEHTTTTRSGSLLERAIEAGEIDAEIVAPGVPTPTVPDAARALGVEERQIIKSLLFGNGDGEVVLAVLSGASRVDRRRLEVVTGLPGLRLADPATVLARTGYPAGGTPPVGHPAPLAVVIDEHVMSLPVAIGGGGRIEWLLRIRPAEIIRVTGATVARIAADGR
jgi:prolyl-tRNA editing enzyme YbaK/EbsC (Cys-tRNA(Pro) deacylase)